MASRMPAGHRRAHGVSGNSPIAGPPADVKYVVSGVAGVVVIPGFDGAGEGAFGADMGGSAAAMDDFETAFVAVGAVFVCGLVPADEIAVGVAVAAVKYFAFFGAFLDDFPGFAVGAGDVERECLGVFAFGVGRACEEFTETASANDHGAAAVRAGAGVFDHLFLRDDFAVGFAREFHRIFASGVVGTGEEVAVFSPLDDHG